MKRAIYPGSFDPVTLGTGGHKARPYSGIAGAPDHRANLHRNIIGALPPGSYVA